MKRIDLNSDIGENQGDDKSLMEIVTSVNIACGAHAGDLKTMEESVRAAAKKGVSIGAHPGYPDRENFGRKAMNMDETDLRKSLKEQISSIKDLAEQEGSKLVHVKAHGALYNTAMKDLSLANLIAGVVMEIDPGLIVFGLPESKMQEACEQMGLRFVGEGFSDRAYHSDGSLRSRSEDGAVLHDPQIVASRALRMAAEKQVKTVEGFELDLAIETLCVHGDTEGALSLARAIRSRLENEDIQVAPVGRPRVFSPAGIHCVEMNLGTAISEALAQDVAFYTQKLRERDFSWVLDWIPTYTGVSVYYDPLQVDYGQVCEALESAGRESSYQTDEESAVIEVPTCYGGSYGPDLERVAQQAGLNVEEVIQRHSQIIYRVYMMGFKPGFAYFGGMDPMITTPRLDTPRLSIPAGSVGIADGQTGIYPVESPGGWNLIGQTPLSLFDPESASPCLLKAGDRVRFVPISKESYEAYVKENAHV